MPGPGSVVADSAGNLLISDGGNNQIRVVGRRPEAGNARSPGHGSLCGWARLLGRYGVMAMATGSFPTVMALPGLLVAVLTGVTVWSLLPT